jgi:ATP-dependent DNA ligase
MPGSLGGGFNLCSADDGEQRERADDPNWICEPKLDGYRAIAVIDEVGSPHLWSRNGLTLEIKFPGIVKAVTKLKLRSTISPSRIVDGFPLKFLERRARLINR